MKMTIKWDARIREFKIEAEFKRDGEKYVWHYCADPDAGKLTLEELWSMMTDDISDSYLDAHSPLM